MSIDSDVIREKELIGRARELYGAFKGPLSIIGPGLTVWDDIKAEPPQGDLMVLSVMGMYWPSFRHWFSIHGEMFPAWENVRAMHKFEPARRKDLMHRIVRPPLLDYLTHSAVGKTNRDVGWPLGRKAHNTGLGGAIVGCCMGYEPITLYGMPGTYGHVFYGLNGHPSHDHGASEAAWKYLRDNFFDGRVRSVSGATKGWLEG